MRKKRRRYFIMVKHVILWQLKDELSDAEKAAVDRKSVV